MRVGYLAHGQPLGTKARTFLSKEGKSFSARSVLGLRVHYRDEVQAAIRLIRSSDQSIVWAGDSDKGEMKKVAERIVNEMLKQRPWAVGPGLGVK